MRAIRLTEAQLSALEVYCTDPLHDEPEADLLRAALKGRTLLVPPESVESVKRFVCDRGNAADEGGDAWVSRPLTAVYLKLCTLAAADVFQAAK